jgi:hypothetical protein
MNYLLNYEEICKDSLIEIRDKICKADKLKMSDLKIDNLIFKQGGDGIYLFFNNDHKCIYVGRCYSRSFVDRIPAHFDARDEIGRWGFRGVCKQIRKERGVTWYGAATELLSWYLYLINFKNNKNKEHYCKKLEILLINIFKEHGLYNRNYSKRSQDINDKDTLKNNLDRIR